MKEIKALVIIPAKMDSTRVKNKNLRIIADKTLLEHSLDYSMNSKYTKDICVTSDSVLVNDIVNSYRHNNILDVYTHMTQIEEKCIHFYKREKEFMGEREVADVYVNVIQNDIHNRNGLGYDLIRHIDEVTHVVGVQPDHPDRTIDLDRLLEYAVENKYDDLFTVNKNGTRNGSIRIMKKEFVESGQISRRVGSFVDNCTNIHSEQDLIDAEANILIKKRAQKLMENQGE
tara:strand:- start:882 stop:1571 length:690 start_codon:yes stop_codon:yes gene_type:complete